MKPSNAYSPLKDAIKQNQSQTVIDLSQLSTYISKSQFTEMQQLKMKCASFKKENDLLKKQLEEMNEFKQAMDYETRHLDAKRHMLLKAQIIQLSRQNSAYKEQLHAQEVLVREVHKTLKIIEEGMLLANKHSLILYEREIKEIEKEKKSGNRVKREKLFAAIDED